MPAQCNPEQLTFAPVEERGVVAAFDGGVPQVWPVDPAATPTPARLAPSAHAAMDRHGSAGLHGHDHRITGPWPDAHVNVPHRVTLRAGGSGVGSGDEEGQAGENGRVS